MMCFIMIFMVPVMYIYSSYSGLSASASYMFDQYSLGNLGGASIACAQVPLAVPGATLTLSCPVGAIQTTATTQDGSTAFQSAVIPGDALASNYCTASAIQVPADSTSITDCAQAFNLDAVLAAVAACDGAATCSIVFNSATTGWDQTFINESVFSAGGYELCYTGAASVMVSAGCIFTDDQVSNRQVQGLLIGCIFISLTLYVVVYLDYIRQVASNNFIEWDVATVTAGDYTIEFDISEEFFNRFIEQHGSKKRIGDTMATHFREWITKEMEDKLALMPDLGFEDEPQERVNIAVTTFAFDNAELINLLRERGAAITADDFNRMREIDAQINTLKNEKLAIFVRPCSVFMTFESEEGYQRANKFDEITESEDATPEIKANRIWLGDQEIDIQEASEPSDIIWENRHFTIEQRRKKAIITALTIGFALFCSFVVVFICRAYSAVVAAKYPLTDC